MTVWFWDPSFHTEDNWGTQMQLLQKVQTLTDAPEGKTIKSQGVNMTIWHNRTTIFGVFYGTPTLIFGSFVKVEIFRSIHCNYMEKSNRNIIKNLAFVPWKKVMWVWNKLSEQIL